MSMQDAERVPLTVLAKNAAACARTRVPWKGCDLNHNEDPEVREAARRYNAEVARIGQEKADELAEARFEAATNRWDRIAVGWCPSCRRAKNDVDEQYSFGVYAGIMCGDCARTKYRDGCGLDGPQGRAEDLEEPLEEE